MLLSLNHLECRYGNTPVIRDLSLTVAAGEICCLLGPSGCGKTTLLQAIAGFNPLSRGSIDLDGRPIARPGDALPPEQRGIGMVFQEYALFPHLTVADNIGFGLRALPSAERARRVGDTLALVQMQALARRYPHELSGGQQQRVALARALAPQPRLLLMDEPFSNLDTELRRALSAEVRDILKIAGMTAIMVTHDREEAFVISDKLGVLDAGVLQQWDRPEAVYQYPANRAVASFVGDGCFVTGRVQAPGRVDSELGPLTIAEAWPPGTELDIYVRPDDVVISDTAGTPARLISRAFLGKQTRYRFELASGRQLEALLPSSRPLAGPDHCLRLDCDQPVVFPSAGVSAIAESADGWAHPPVALSG